MRYSERLPKKLEWLRRDSLAKNYHLTVEEYDAISVSQGGLCAICGQTCRTGKRLAVDHDHRCCPSKSSCGRCVRGLLCYHCNAVVVRVAESPLMGSALAYLEKHAS